MSTSLQKIKFCIRCGERPPRTFGGNKNGSGRSPLLCEECTKGRLTHQRNVSRDARRAKDTKCARCGFVALHRCQLDVDHIDGNRDNDAVTNLQTLCANCHRLKSYLSQEHVRWEKKDPVRPPQLRLIS